MSWPRNLKYLLINMHLNKVNIIMVKVHIQALTVKATMGMMTTMGTTWAMLEKVEAKDGEAKAEEAKAAIGAAKARRAKAKEAKEHQLATAVDMKNI